MINNHVSNYYAQLTAQQAAQGTSSQGAQGTSDADIQQWLASFLSGGSTAAASSASASGTAVCTGASSSTAAISGQNLIQAMDDQTHNNPNVTSQTQTASTGSAVSTPISGHPHHHGGGKASQADQSWFTDGSENDSISSPAGGGDTAPASFASLLNTDNTANITQSIWNSIA